MINRPCKLRKIDLIYKSMINVITVHAPDDLELEQKINDLPGDLVHIVPVDGNNYKLIYIHYDTERRSPQGTTTV